MSKGLKELTQTVQYISVVFVKYTRRLFNKSNVSIVFRIANYQKLYAGPCDNDVVDAVFGRN